MRTRFDERKPVVRPKSKVARPFVRVAERPLRVLVACESSGAVRDAFARNGHDAWSCDLLPTESPGNHYLGDARQFLGEGWDLLIAHPPCTYLTVSGNKYFKEGTSRRKDVKTGQARWDAQKEALDLVRSFLDAPIPKIAVENPVGVISTHIRPASQYIQPYQFGDDASKKTGLWLKGLPLLRPTQYVEGREVVYQGKRVRRWSNQTDSGQNHLPPSEDRWKERSKTYEGIAQAMADQWGGIVGEDL
jgi:hypothetical protein